LAACWGGRHHHEDGDCRAVRSGAGVRGVEAMDFEHKDAATSNGVFGLGLRVVFCIAINAVQEESIGPVEARVV
jgi:hypothetical protein